MGNWSIFEELRNFGHQNRFLCEKTSYMNFFSGLYDLMGPRTVFGSVKLNAIQLNAIQSNAIQSNSIVEEAVVEEAVAEEAVVEGEGGGEGL